MTAMFWGVIDDPKNITRCGRGLVIQQKPARRSDVAALRVARKICAGGQRGAAEETD